jgi:hypothetical protein
MWHNELCLCGGRACTELTTQSQRAGRGGPPGPEHAHAVNGPRVGQSGPEVGILTPDTRSRGGEGMSGAPCRCQIFTMPIRAGKLKNWKSEKLIACPRSQFARISGFQVFTRTAAPEILPIGPGRGWGGEYPECARTRFFRVCLY